VSRDADFPAAGPERVWQQCAELGFDQVGEVIGQRAGAGELAVAVGIDFTAGHDFFGEQGFFIAGLVADAFGDGDDAATEPGVNAIDVGEEAFFVEVDFGQVDEVRSVGVIEACEGGGGGEPAGIAAHDAVDLDALEERLSASSPMWPGATKRPAEP